MMEYFEITLILLIVLYIVLNVYLSYKLIGADFLEFNQKAFQLIIIWFIPYLGFFMVYYVLIDDFNEPKRDNKANDNSTDYERYESTGASSESH